jgi:hypothetical protein
LDSLANQTFSDFEVIVVDNSESHPTASLRGREQPRLRIIEAGGNLGYGGAFNRAMQESQAPYVIALNDDTIAEPDWLHYLVEAAETHSNYGAFTSMILLRDSRHVDSTGLLMSLDGSAIQRAHNQSADKDQSPQDTLLPSGCAVMYRRKMLEEIGVFDESYFLYVEDVDLGMRAQWAGWPCYYARRSVIHHHYSLSAGRFSPLKAYLIERNRLRMVVSNFPLPDLLFTFPASTLRYFFHALAVASGDAKVRGFLRKGGNVLQLPLIVLRAHLSMLKNLPALLRKRKATMNNRRLTSAEFRRLLRAHRTTLLSVARH